MSGRAIRAVLLGLSAALSPGAPSAAGPPPPPIPLPTTERVEVRLVLVDVLVLDAKGRTVPDLRPEDFAATVDGEEVPVDTLDVDCPESAADDAAAVQAGSGGEPAAAGAVPRRLVLVVDDMHLARTDRARVLDWVKDVVENRSAPGDEIMVAALDLTLRVEQAFTADRRQVLRTLDRMMHDITLWQPSFAHGSDQPFFDSLQALLGVLEFTPGRKAVVLFSNLGDASRDFDDEFAELAASAVDARAPIYTVHAAGLDPPPF